MSDDHYTNVAMFKLFLIWIGTVAGGVSLSGLVLTATLVFTLLQIFMLLRRLWKDLP